MFYINHKIIEMLRDRRKSLTLERRSPPPERLQRGSERRGSFAAPSSTLHPPEQRHERRGSLVTRYLAIFLYLM